MGRTVVVASGSARDLEAFKALADEAVTLVDEQLPGTETYECYIDEATSRFTWHEEYASDEAIVAHLQAMIGSGVFDKLPEVADFDFAVALGGPREPKAQAAMEEMGFGIYELHTRAKPPDSAGAAASSL